MLNVRDLGVNSICESHVKPNDVRVFLLKLYRGIYDDEPFLSLNSSLIRIDSSINKYSGQNEKEPKKCSYFNFLCF